MRRSSALAAFLLAAVVLGIGAAPVPYTVTDTLGRTLAFPRVPERIVIAGKGTLLLVDAVYLFPGAGSRVIGAGATDQGLGDFYPLLEPGFRQKTRFANTVGPEPIAGLHPDLVILKSYNRDRLGNPLEKLGIPVMYLDLESPERFFADVASLGLLFQQPERARLVADWYRSRAQAVASAVASARKPSVLIVQRSARDGRNAFSVPPAAWIQTAMVETAGGTAVWKDAGPGEGWKKVGIEQVAAWNPEFVLLVSYQESSVSLAEQLAESGILKGKILPFPADFHSWDQPDSRWILGLQWIAAEIHPELFPALDIRAEATSFYSTLYGIDGSTIEREILPRLAGAHARR